MSTTLTLSVRDLRVTYPKRGLFGKPFTAVEGVSFDVQPGKTLGVVGESGSGKSTIGRAILGLAQVKAGTIKYGEQEISSIPLSKRETLSRKIQVIFQDPFSSLNPSMTIGEILLEPLGTSGRYNRRQNDQRLATLLDRVSLPGNTIHRYPREFSGGQRQRIAIARALIVDPSLVVCDEPTSALDLTTQAQVLELLTELQRDLGVSYLFISHDLAVVRQVSHTVMVLQKGKVVEQGPTELVTKSPSNPYTELLLAAAPVPNPREQAARREHRRELVQAGQ